MNRLNQSVDYSQTSRPGMDGSASGRNGLLPALGVNALSPRIMNNQNSVTNFDSPRKIRDVNGSNSPSPSRNSHHAIMSGANRSKGSAFTVRNEARELARSMAQPDQNKVSLSDMVQSSKKTNDEWGVKGYHYAPYNFHLDKPTVYKISVLSPESQKNPRDYISMLMRQKEKIPGPEKYFKDNIGMQTLGKNGKCFIPKGKTLTFFQQVEKDGKKSPGVGKYDMLNSKKSKIHGNYLFKEKTGGFTDSAVFQGMTTPSHYNSVDIDKIKDRTISYRIQKPKDKVKETKKDSPSPMTYKKEEAFDKTQRTNIQYGIPKGNKQSFTDFEIKKTKIVPGVGKYNITTADKIITLGARRGYK